jgi:hypothetical protein
MLEGEIAVGTKNFLAAIDISIKRLCARDMSSRPSSGFPFGIFRAMKRENIGLVSPHIMLVLPRYLITLHGLSRPSCHRHSIAPVHVH